ncbi:MAG: TlpA family protein disulfide reductase [Thermogutta sp.]
MLSRLRRWQPRKNTSPLGRDQFPARRRSSQKVLAYRVFRDIALAVLCLLAIIGFFHWRPFAGPDPMSQPAVGRPASFLEVYPLEKVLARLNLSPFEEPEPLTMKELTGQVTLVIFWGPWNEPSVRALRRILGVLPVLSRKDFRLIAVACPPPAGLEMPADFLSWTEATWKDCQVPFPCYLDLQGTTQARFAVLNQKHATESGRPPLILPTAVLINEKGIIEAVWEGWLPNYEQNISQEVDRFLGPPFPSQQKVDPPPSEPSHDTSASSG